MLPIIVVSSVLYNLNMKLDYNLAIKCALGGIIGSFIGSFLLSKLNDKYLKVVFYLDEDFFNDQGIIGIHPNDNIATLWIEGSD